MLRRRGLGLGFEPKFESPNDGIPQWGKYGKSQKATKNRIREKNEKKKKDKQNLKFK